MRRAKAKEVSQQTKQLTERNKNKYDFITDDFLLKIQSDCIDAGGAINIISVLQNDIFKLQKHCVIYIESPSVLCDGTVQMAIGDVYVTRTENRFVILHYKNAQTILYKDATGARMPNNFVQYLPPRITVLSNLHNDGLYHHLQAIRNIEIIVRADDVSLSYETFSGFTKTTDLDMFRDWLFHKFKAIHSKEYVRNELHMIANNTHFQYALKLKIQKFVQIDHLAQIYLQTAETDTDVNKVEVATQELLNALKRFGQTTHEEDIAVRFPTEMEHFNNLFTHLQQYDVNEDYMLYVKHISETLNIDYDMMQQFFDNKHQEVDVTPSTIESATPSDHADQPDSILEKYSKLNEVVHQEVTDHLNLAELLDRIKQDNDLADRDVMRLHQLYTETMHIYNANWKPKTVHDIQKWGKSKRGKAKLVDIPEVLAVCIRAHQIISKGLITLRDIQILAALLFLINVNGNFAQIITGEGKTIIISLLCVFKVLEGFQVDVITSNEVLAHEGLNDMRDFYYLFGIYASCNNYDPSYKDGPRACYGDDIVYGTIGNFEFDHLRDYIEDSHTRGQRRFDFVILDEVDSLTIDNGAHIAKLAQPFPGLEYLRYVYINIWITLCNVEEEFRKQLKNELTLIANQCDKSDVVIEDEYNAMLLKRIKGMQPQLKEMIKADRVLLDIPVIPNHLRMHCGEMVDQWIENAISAKYNYRIDEDYVLKKVRTDDDNISEFVVVPVDYANTGVTMANTIWSNGIHQFLQLKHNLKITSESLTASFISNLGYIRLYNNNIYGMTGTLGSIAEQQFLSSLYNLTYFRIPTFAPKLFYEIEGVLIKDDSWADYVVIDAYLKVKQNRSVLVISETIKDVQILKEHFERLRNVEDAKWIKPRYYFDESYTNVVLHADIGIGEVIFATNIAGRGTDFKTTQELEANGGLHVCVTFLPCNERVEQQAFGRTSRKGNYGSAQLIVKESHVAALNCAITGETTMEDIKRHRDDIELVKLNGMRDGQVKDVLLRDQLFGKFADTYQQLMRKHRRSIRGMYLALDLKECWAFWLRKQNAIDATNIDSEYQHFLQMADPILTGGRISFNPYYAIKMAEHFIQSYEYDEANEALELAETLSKSDAGLFSAQVKLFEILISNSGQAENIFLAALNKLFPSEARKTHVTLSDYKEKAIRALKCAHDGLKLESEYMLKLLHNTEFHKAIGAGRNSIECKIEDTPLWKHLLSRANILSTFLGHVIDLLDKLKCTRDNVRIDGKSNDYFKTFKSDDAGQMKIKQKILNAEVKEMNNIGMSTLYSITDMPSVKDGVIADVKTILGTLGNIFIEGIKFMLSCISKVVHSVVNCITLPCVLAAILGVVLRENAIRIISMATKTMEIGKTASLFELFMAYGLKLVQLAQRGLAYLFSPKALLIILAVVVVVVAIVIIKRMLESRTTHHYSQYVSLEVNPSEVRTKETTVDVYLEDNISTQLSQFKIEAKEALRPIVVKTVGDKLDHLNRKDLEDVLNDPNCSSKPTIDLIRDTIDDIITICCSWKALHSRFSLLLTVFKQHVLFHFVGNYCKQILDKTQEVNTSDTKNSPATIKELTDLILEHNVDELSDFVEQLLNGTIKTSEVQVDTAENPANDINLDQQHPMTHRGNIQTLSRTLQKHIIVIIADTHEAVHFGAEFSGDPLVINYSPPTRTSYGHYWIPGHEVLVPSGHNNCFYDALKILLERRGVATTAAELRRQATALTFANAVYDDAKIIYLDPHVFNSPSTYNTYNKVQRDILVGGREPYKDKPLDGKKYPSGRIQITTDNEEMIEELKKFLEEFLQDHIRQVRDSNVYACGDKATVENPVTIIMDPQQNEAAVNYVISRVPFDKNNKTRPPSSRPAMYGVLHVKLSNGTTLKLMARSGDDIYISKIVKTDNNDWIYRLKDSKLRYKPVALTYVSNMYKFLNRGKLIVGEFYDLITKEPCQFPDSITNSKKSLSCAAMKLLAQLGKYLRDNNVNIVGDISMAELFFDGENVWKHIQDSCDRCKVMLPIITGAGKDPKNDKKKKPDKKQEE